MDFTNINSITDLLKENSKVKGEEDVVLALCKPVYQEDPSVGLSVTIEILTELLGFHKEVVDQAVADGDALIAANWSVDMGKIDEIITTLKGIQL